MDFADCLICGHRVWKHNFHDDREAGTPCPDCPDGICPNMTSPEIAPVAAPTRED
jgi:hypothetical protein